MEKYKYKHLTDDMKNALDAEIRKYGKDVVCDRISKNLAVEQASQLQSKPDAFDVVGKGPWKAIKWELDYFETPYISGSDELVEEMFHYIDNGGF